MSLATKVKTLVDEQTVLDNPPIDPAGVMVLSNSSKPSATTHILVGPSRSAPQSESILKQANQGDLDWYYTSRCVRRWSPNSLLTHLHSHAFSVPPRDTKLSFPFVNINVFSQDGDDPETVSLPQAYRLPLLMVAKYLWETVHLALSAGREEWTTQKTNIFHISRLCDNLFTGARVKTAKGGMEQGWRCLMFERFLTRFYNYWIQNDPASNETFWKEHGAKEYEKDVLKHDWKRWSLTGLNGIRLTEQEVNWGVSADQFRKTLILNRDPQTWTLEGKTLSFITSDEGPAWSSVSELTDVDLVDDEEEVKPLLDAKGTIVPPSASPNKPLIAFGNGSPAKRLRFSHRSSAVHQLPKKLPDQARLSTLRKSARTPAPGSFRGSNSALHHSTSLPETGFSQGISSSDPLQIQPSNRSKQPPSQELVVLIKRRPQVPQTESSEQASIRNSHAGMSSAPGITDLTQSPLPNLSKRVSRPSSTKTGSDAARRAKRRKVDEFNIGKVEDATPVQASTHLAPCTPTNSSKPNGVPHTWVIQRANSMHVDVSVQTMVTMDIAIEQGTQTDICVGSEMNIDRDAICDSSRMPTATIMTKATSDVAAQTEPSPLTGDNSLNVHQMGNGMMECCTAEMQKDLSHVVDNLVSSRLVSVMRALKQSSEPGPASGSGTNSSSPTVCESSALPSTSGAASTGMDRNLVNGLFDEVRLLREEANSREQKTREEMRALRHLHNAEVDSLRRRLAYLESQSHEQEKNCDARRDPGEPSYRGRSQYTNGNSTTVPPRLGDKNYHFPDDDIPGSSFDVRSSLRTPGPVPEPFSNGNGSGRLFSTNRNRNDMEEGSPLPSKTQRKSHIIAFPRPG